MQLIHPPHHRQVIWAYRRWPVIMRRACDLQQTALPHHRQHRVSMVHQCQSVRRAHGPDLLRKKSRSTVSWPIFSNRGASCASLAAASSFPLEDPRAKSDAMPSSNVFRHAWIWLACTPNRLDSSATVPSSRTAASATFALNSAPCFLRVFPMSHLRPTGRSKGRLSLNNLSSFRGPPHLTSVPDHLPNRIRSPSFTSRGTSWPCSLRVPGPTASTFPSIGFSCAVSGMMIPPVVFSSAFTRRITTRSCKGRNFIGFCLTSCQPLEAGRLAPRLARTLQVQVIWHFGPASAKHLVRCEVAFKLSGGHLHRNQLGGRVSASESR